MRALRALRRRAFSLFARKGKPSIGIYGAPNAGKTQLANTMCADWDGDVRGSVSEVPHETRHVETRQKVTLRSGDSEIVLDVMDTPGLSSNVSVLELEMLYGMSEAEAQQRAEEAMNGMIDALKAVDSLSGVLLVLDATQDPLQQVNRVLLANIRARNVKCIVVANKIDLPDADVSRVRRTFTRFPVVGVSALQGHNMDELYDVMIKEFG